MAACPTLPAQDCAQRNALDGERDTAFVTSVYANCNLTCEGIAIKRLKRNESGDDKNNQLS